MVKGHNLFGFNWSDMADYIPLESPDLSADSGYDIPPANGHFPSEGQDPGFTLTPVYPRFIDYKARISTFDTFPPQILPEPSELCAAGLF